MPNFSLSRVEVHVFRRISGRISYLALHYAEGQNAGAWGILDGELREGESSEQAVVRVLREGTGASPLGLWAVDFVRTHYDPRSACLYFIPTFAVEMAEEVTLQLAPAYEKSRWIAFEQALEIMRLHSHREGLKYVQSDIVAAPDRGALFRLPLPE